MEVHGYTQSGQIKVTIDGVEYIIPDDAGDRYRKVVAEWESEGNTIPAYSAPPPTISDVKEEARKRIVAICPEWKQLDLTAQAAILTEKGRSNWTTQELAEWNAGKAIWDSIKALRDASDTLEAMDPIPSDYTDNSYWT